jgi:hypothetical protein
MHPHQILINENQETPAWLLNYRAGRRFPRKKFFQERVVFYPGAGSDFHPLEIFGGAGAAHCFVMADYWFTLQQVADVLSNAHVDGFGLDSLVRLSLEEVFKPNWTRHFDQDLIEEDERLRFFKMINSEGFAFFALFNNGSRRLALLYLGYEAVEAYDRLFCQGRSPKPPYGILVQNHGMGGDWNQMANPDSYVAQLADEFGRPRWLIGEDGRKNWRDYAPVSDITYGGINSTARRLFSTQFLLKLVSSF